jgi:hypothetical protein
MNRLRRGEGKQRGERGRRRSHFSGERWAGGERAKKGSSPAEVLEDLDEVGRLEGERGGSFRLWSDRRRTVGCRCFRHGSGERCSDERRREMDVCCCVVVRSQEKRKLRQKRRSESRCKQVRKRREGRRGKKENNLLVILAWQVLSA